MTDMDSAYRPGNVTCVETRELLSDLIDVRRGEIPHPDGSRLSIPGMRAAVELHLAACPDCQNELRLMQEVGTAFAEFSVNEPPAQHFENYGGLIRARLARQEAATRAGQAAGFRPRRMRLVWFGAATLAAASLMLAALRALPPAAKPEATAAQPIDYSAQENVADVVPSTPPPSFPISRTPTALNVAFPNMAAQRFLHDPAQPAGMQKLEEEEGRLGYLVLAESTPLGGAPLLGAYLRTTRDVDHVVNDLGGLVVYDVAPDSTAANMGLRKGDRIVWVNNTDVANGGTEEAVKFLTGIIHLGAGQRVSLHVVRKVGSQYLYLKPLEGTLGR